MSAKEFRRDSEGRIICPKCNTPIQRIYRFVSDHYTIHWNPKSKRYDVSWDGGSHSVCCGNCAASLCLDDEIRINPVEEIRS